MPDAQLPTNDSAPIEFIDPTTGEAYNVAPRKATVEAAYKLGYIPATAEAMDRADQVTEDGR